MVNKKQWLTLAAFLSYLLHPADGFTGTPSELPQCGLSCILDSIPQSSCYTISNTTCLCNNDGLQAAVQQCLRTRCTVLEGISMSPCPPQSSPADFNTKTLRESRPTYATSHEDRERQISSPHWLSRYRRLYAHF